MKHFQRELCRSVLMLFTTCVLLSEPGKGRRISSAGDILGTRYETTSNDIDDQAVATPRSREIADHAHFYNAAEVLTRWAETTFALTASAHKQLISQPDAGSGSACVYDGVQCLFNPYMVTGTSFPEPELQAEKVLKRFTMEAYVCRQAQDRPSCHLDSNCDWDDLTGACFLAHDPHIDLTSSIAPCRDMLYTAVAAACWRREPVRDSIRPCGGAACRLFQAGTGGSWPGGGGAGAVPEDRCMPVLGLASSLTPMDMYSLMKRYFGTAKLKPQELANVTLAAQILSGQLAQSGHEEGLPLKRGYGNCSTAGLHYTMRSTCRQWEQGACLTDTRCKWTTVVHGKHCVLSKDTVIDELLGTGNFTRAVRKGEAACQTASSEAACKEVVLVL